MGDGVDDGGPQRRRRASPAAASVAGYSITASHGTRVGAASAPLEARSHALPPQVPARRTRAPPLPGRRHRRGAGRGRRRRRARAVPEPGLAAPPAAAGRDDGNGLTADVFYRLLLGDVALQRGEKTLAARAYFEAARDTRDPRLARRAAEIALSAGMRGLAQGSARLWSALDPAAERPKQILAALAAGNAGKAPVEGVYDSDLKARVEKLLAEAATTERGLGDLFLQLNGAFGELDRRQTYELIRDVAKPYPEERRGALRRRARRAPRRPAGQRHRQHGARGDRPRAGAEARLGARGAPEGRGPRPQEARRGSRTSRSSSRPTRTRAPRPARSRRCTSSSTATPRPARSSSACGTATGARANTSSASPC